MSLFVIRSSSTIMDSNDDFAAEEGPILGARYSKEAAIAFAKVQAQKRANEYAETNQTETHLVAGDDWLRPDCVFAVGIMSATDPYADEDDDSEPDEEGYEVMVVSVSEVTDTE